MFVYRVFVIEDDEAISRLLCMNLSIAGYEPVPAGDGQEALNMIQRGERFDVALVDVMLPGIDGFQLMEPLKAHGVPVIYLTAKNDLESKLTGLTSGAEDYIVKPFEVMELLVRMEKVLARHCAGGVIAFADLTVYVEERTVLKGGRSIQLKPLEFDLLLFFLRNQNIALSREKILAEVWGMDFYGESRTIDIHVSSLRRKTGLSIVSVPRIGYRLETAP
jgi:DNA-binding response OmpR family regulator